MVDHLELLSAEAAALFAVSVAISAMLFGLVVCIGTPRHNALAFAGLSLLAMLGVLLAAGAVLR